MGIDKKPEEVQELMNSVDKDGSGVWHIRLRRYCRASAHGLDTIDGVDVLSGS